MSYWKRVARGLVRLLAILFGLVLLGAIIYITYWVIKSYPSIILAIVVILVAVILFAFLLKKIFDFLAWLGK